MHGYDWQGQDLAGHIITEKMDGCRAYWCGAELRTKSGRPYRNIPAGLLAELQAAGCALDCELWVPGAHRGASLAAATAAALRGVWAPELRITPFDLPEHGRAAAFRVYALARNCPNAAPFRVATSTAQALEWRDAAIRDGREGLMALDPAGLYRPGRRAELLKLK